jgi:hypothetical protein
MEVPDFLSVHGRDSVRSSHIAGLRLPVTMETGKHETGFTGAVLSENHLHAGEEGKFDL